MTDSIEHFWAIIPAGGAGTRLWPLSRRGVPKFLHDLTGSGRTLLQGTWDRLVPLAQDRVVVVTGVDHVARVSEQLPGLDPAHLLAEPSPRDSMPAIALGAAVVARRDPDAVIGSFAADHVITGVAGFHDAVAEAVAVARTGQVVTLGITPTYAATGFGYIREGDALEVQGAPSARAVAEFVEKPDAQTAAAYLATGRFRWNAGMFVVSAQVLLDLVRQWHPAIADGAEAIAADPSRLGALWPGLTKIAIDHALAEPAAAAGRVAVVPASFGWDDVGDFDSLASLLERRAGLGELGAGVGERGAGAGERGVGAGERGVGEGERGVGEDGIPGPGGPGGGPTLHVLGDARSVIARDSTGLVVAGGGRMVAVIGLDDVVVVDSPDAVLVVPRARAQEVKAVVDQLADLGRDDLR